MTDRAKALPSADDELLVTRSFDAPASLVFRLWEDNAHRIRWWGPKDFTTTHLDSDFRVDGRWRARIKSERYGETWMSGVYREIERDRRIVFTFMWEENNEQAGVETLVTVTFEEKDGKTIQHFHQTPFINVAVRDSHIGGWSELIDKEADYAERIAKGETP